MYRIMYKRLNDEHSGYIITSVMVSSSGDIAKSTAARLNDKLDSIYSIVGVKDFNAIFGSEAEFTVIPVQV